LNCDYAESAAFDVFQINWRVLIGKCDPLRGVYYVGGTVTVGYSKYNKLRNISGSKKVAELSKKKILSLQGENPALAEG